MEISIQFRRGVFETGFPHDDTKKTKNWLAFHNDQFRRLLSGLLGCAWDDRAMTRSRCNDSGWFFKCVLSVAFYLSFLVVLLWVCYLLGNKGK